MYNLPKKNLKNRCIKKKLVLSVLLLVLLSLSLSLCMCYCCSQSDEQSTFSNNTTTTTTTDNTNTESDTDSDQKSKPWLSRMFASSDKSGTNVDPSASTTADGKFNAKKHFDLKNVSHDFNKPAGIAAAPGVRLSKSGRKIRWEGQESIKKSSKTNYKISIYQNWTQLRVKLNYSVLLSTTTLSLYQPNYYYYLTYLVISY